MQVQSKGQEDPLEKKMATHMNTLAWEIPWMEDPGKLQQERDSMEGSSVCRVERTSLLRRVGHGSFFYLPFPTLTSPGLGESGGAPGVSQTIPQGFHEPCKFPSFLPGDSESLNLG